MWPRPLAGVLFGALVLALPVPSTSASDNPSVDELAEKYIKAVGGRKKLDSVNSLRTTGKVVFGGMEAPLLIETRRPDKVRIEFTFQGLSITRAYDGKVGWFINPMMGSSDPQKMPEDELKSVADRADMDGPLVDYKKKGHQIEFVGKKDIDGKPAYELKITKKNGDVERHFLDAESHLLARVSGSGKFQGQAMEFDVLYSDYKDVDGLKVAHTVEQRQGSSDSGAVRAPGTSMKYEKVEVNVDIPDSRFSMPEVKKEEPPKATP